MDCKKCKDKPYYPKNKCCFNCGKDADKCQNTHFCGEDCKEWVEGKTNQNYEWVDVKERLPERDGDAVLCYVKNTSTEGVTYVTGCIQQRKFWFLQTCNIGVHTFPNHYWKVTHWMPLPEPPKERGDNE